MTQKGFVGIGVEVQDRIGNESKEEHDEHHDKEGQDAGRDSASQISLDRQTLEVELVTALVTFPQRVWAVDLGSRPSQAELVDVSHAALAMTWFDKSAVFVVVFVFDEGALQASWHTWRVEGDGGIDIFKAQPTGSRRVGPGWG